MDEREREERACGKKEGRLHDEHTDLAVNLFLLREQAALHNDQCDPIVWGCSWRVAMSRIRLANVILKFIMKIPTCLYVHVTHTLRGGGPEQGRPGGARSEQHCAGRRSTLSLSFSFSFRAHYRNT